MASLVIADDTGRYDGTHLETRPLRGTESSVIRLARALAARGHSVTVYSNCDAPVADHGVHWRPLRAADPQPCDLYLPVQHPRLFGLVPARRLAVWLLWRANNLKHYKQLPRVWRYRPIPLLMSHYQAWGYSWLLPRRRQVLIPLGLPDDIRGLAPLATPPPPHAIFASNPARNLYGLVELWTERILPKRPDAVLHIYGMTAEQAADPWRTSRVLPQIPEQARASIRIHAPVARDALMAAMRGARVMAYLGHKTEAFCLSLAEAQALGVPAVVAPIAVLPERVLDGETGFVRGDPQDFAEAVLSLLNDDDLWKRQHQAALLRQQGISWDEYAARFEAALLADL